MIGARGGYLAHTDRSGYPRPTFKHDYGDRRMRRIATWWMFMSLLALSAAANDDWHTKQAIVQADPTRLCEVYNSSAHYSIFPGTGYTYKVKFIHPSQGIGYIPLSKAQFDELSSGRPKLERTVRVATQKEAQQFERHLRGVAKGITMPYWLGALNELLQLKVVGTVKKVLSALGATNTLLSVLEENDAPRILAADLAALIVAGGEFQQFAALRSVGDGRYVLSQWTTYKVKVQNEVRNYVVCSLTAPAHVDTPVPLRVTKRSADIDRAAWKAAAYVDLSKTNTAAQVGRLRYAVEVYRAQPRRKVDEVAVVLRRAPAAMETPYVGPVAAWRVAADLAERDAGGRQSTTASIAQEFAKYAPPVSNVDSAAVLRLTPHQADALRDVTERTISDAWDLARKNSSFRALLEKEFTALAESPMRSAQEIFANRDLGLPATMIASLASGTMPDKQAVIAAFTASQHDVLASLTNARSDLVRLDAARTRTDLEAVAKALDVTRKFRDTSVLLESADGRVVLLADVARLLGAPDLARQIDSVGGAAIQITKAVSAFRQALAGTGAASGIGSALLSGNCVQAVTAVAMSLLDQGPSVEHVTLEQLAAIRQQIAQLSVEMHERFDRVDAQLNAIMTSLNQNFGLLFDAVRAISQGLTDIQATVSRIESSLAELQVSVVRLEFRIRRYLVAGFDRPVKENLLRCLDYEQQFPASTMTDAQFKECLFKFSAHATIDAFDALAVPREASVRDDRMVITVLNEFDSLSSVEYLHKLLRYQAGADLVITSGRLPSGSEWAVAADAYATMLAKYPTLARSAAPAQIERLIELGGSLENAIDALHAKAAVMPAAARYASAFERLSAVLLKEEQDYRATHMAGSSFDVTPASVKDYVPATMRQGYLQPCTPANISEEDAYRREGLVRPSSALRLPDIRGFIPKEMLLAEHLGLGTINICYFVYDFHESHSTAVRPPSGARARPLFVYLHDSVRIGIEGTFTTNAGVKAPFFRRVVESGPTERVQWATKRDADGVVSRLVDLLPILGGNWDSGWNLHARFAAGAVEQLSAQAITAAQEAVKRLVVDALREHRAALTATLVRGFEQLKGVSLTANELDARLAVLVALCTVGMSHELLTNDDFAGFITGANRLRSSENLRDAIALTLRDGGSLASILNEESKKIAGFQNVLTALAATEGKRGHAVISRSLDSLRAAAALVANVRSTTPNGNSWTIAGSTDPLPAADEPNASSEHIETRKRACRSGDPRACTDVATAFLARCGGRPSPAAAETKWLSCAELANCWTHRAASLNRVEDACVVEKDPGLCRQAREALAKWSCHTN